MVLRNKYKSLLFFFVIYFYLSGNALARVENDFGLWSGVNVNTPITEKVLSKFQFSPRLLDDSTDFNQFILHALLGYKPNKNFSFFQGYAWSTLYIPNFKREQRPYQEFNIYHDVDKLSFEHRFRLEERFLQGIDAVSLRSRYRLKGIYPLGKDDKWSLVIFDELFLNLNSHQDGPQAGFDQNRIYAGVNRKLNQYINVDLGYQLQHSHVPGPKSDKFNHFLFMFLNYNLPQLVQNK